MSSKQDDRVHQQQRSPENKMCFDCLQPGIQTSVCFPFAIFICTICSGIHRQFPGHTVCTISMTKFRQKMVEDLEKGGNKRAEEKYLALYKSNIRDVGSTESIKTFIRHCFEDRLWMVNTTNTTNNNNNSNRNVRNNTTNSIEAKSERSRYAEAKKLQNKSLMQKKLKDGIKKDNDAVEEVQLESWQGDTANISNNNNDTSEELFNINDIDQIGNKQIKDKVPINQNTNQLININEYTLEQIIEHNEKATSFDQQIFPCKAILGEPIYDSSIWDTIVRTFYGILENNSSMPPFVFAETINQAAYFTAVAFNKKLQATSKQPHHDTAKWTPLEKLSDKNIILKPPKSIFKYNSLQNISKDISNMSLQSTDSAAIAVPRSSDNDSLTNLLQMANSSASATTSNNNNVKHDILSLGDTTSQQAQKQQQQQQQQQQYQQQQQQQYQQQQYQQQQPINTMPYPQNMQLLTGNVNQLPPSRFMPNTMGNIYAPQGYQQMQLNENQIMNMPTARLNQAPMNHIVNPSQNQTNFDPKTYPYMMGINASTIPPVYMYQMQPMQPSQTVVPSTQGEIVNTKQDINSTIQSYTPYTYKNIANMTNSSNDDTLQNTNTTSNSVNVNVNKNKNTNTNTVGINEEKAIDANTINDDDAFRGLTVDW